MTEWVIQQEGLGNFYTKGQLYKKNYTPVQRVEKQDRAEWWVVLLRRPSKTKLPKEREVLKVASDHIGVLSSKAMFHGLMDKLPLVHVSPILLNCFSILISLKVSTYVQVDFYDNSNG